MREKGFDVSDNIRTQLDESMVNNADLVVVMAEKDNWPEYLKNNPKVLFWDVLDPKGKDLDFYRKIRDEVYELVNTLDLNTLKL